MHNRTSAIWDKNPLLNGTTDLRHERSYIRRGPGRRIVEARVGSDFILEKTNTRRATRDQRVDLRHNLFEHGDVYATAIDEIINDLCSKET
jgi:hypothetical protein